MSEQTVNCDIPCYVRLQGRFTFFFYLEEIFNEDILFYNSETKTSPF